MKKLVYTPVQIIIICALVLIGISKFASDNSFIWDVSGTPSCVFSYIQPGTYSLTVSCAPVDQVNHVTVFSNASINTSGEAGIIIAQASLEPGQNTVSIPLSLEQGIYKVCVATDLDTNNTSFVTDAHLESIGTLYRDGAFLGCLCFLSALILAVIFIKIPREKYIMPLNAVFIGLLAGIPMYVEFIFVGHDLYFHIQRIEGLYQAMASGNFSIRLNPLLTAGYGYLSPTMYPQLFLYPIAMLRFLNVSIITCSKVFISMLNIGTALIAYYAAKNITGSDKIGILTSFLYTCSAYRLVCMYLRAALGEGSAITFLPLILWGIYECLWGQNRWLILVLGMTGVIQSHVLSTEMCVLFILLELLWWLCSRRKTNIQKRVMTGVKAIVITILLNLSFIIPFLYFSTQELQCFNMNNISANSVVYFSQMFSLFLNVGGSSLPKGTTHHEMPLTVGTALLVGFIIFFIWSGKLSKDASDKKLHFIGIHCAVYALLALFLASWLMPWSGLILRIPLIDKLTASLQFVWRFLGPASLFMVLCTSIALISIQEERRELNWLTGIVVTLCLVTTWSFFDELKELDGYINPMALEAEAALDDVYQHYLYNSTSSYSYSRETAVPKTANETSVIFSDYKKDGTHISTNVTPLQNAEDYLMFPLYYYPGYEIKINGEKTDVFCVDSLVACHLPSAQSYIEVNYIGLPLFKMGDLVSLFTGLGFCFVFIMKRLKRSR